MRSFTTILAKELKDMLRDRALIVGIVIVPLVIYPALGHMVSSGIEEAEKGTEIVLVNLDKGEFGTVLVQALQGDENIRLTNLSAESRDDAIKEAREEGYSMVVVIPGNFSENIESNRTAYVEVYGLLDSFGEGMRNAVTEGRINAVIAVLNEHLAKMRIEQNMGGDPDVILRPIEARGFTVVKGHLVDAPPSVVSNIIASQSFTVPLVIFIMVMVVAQMAANAMAVEKENKTLETLLTLPVKRTTIVAGKMVGVSVIGIIASGAYIIGMRSYMGEMLSSSEAGGLSLEQLGLEITPLSAAMFAAVVFLTLIFTLSLAMFLGVFARDSKSAGAVVSAGILPLAFPTFILMFSDTSTLPPLLKYLLLAIPFSHPITASRAMLMGDLRTISISIAYLTVLCVFMVLVVSHIFTTERVLTARMKWPFSRGRGGEGI